MNTITSNQIVDQLVAEIRARLQGMPIPAAAPVKVAKTKQPKAVKPAKAKPASPAPVATPDNDIITPESLLAALTSAGDKWIVPTSPKRSWNTFCCIKKHGLKSKVEMSAKPVRDRVYAFRLRK